MNSSSESLLAYFRELTQTNQCELCFVLDMEISGIKLNEEIKAVTRVSDDNTVGLFLKHIENKINKILLDTQMKNLQISKEEIIKNDSKGDISVSLIKSKNEHIKPEMLLTSLCTSLAASKKNFFLRVNELNFYVKFNAPLIKVLKLATHLFVDCVTQPIKFQAVHIDKKQSLFQWYKSTDKIHWKEIGEGFKYTLKNDDVGYYIKLVCTPLNEYGIQGPIAQDISATVVDRLDEIPTCPFEKRHELTQSKLQGLNFRVVSYNILADRYATETTNYEWCPPKFIAIEYRKQLILKELSGYKADIICLQEVDDNQFSKYFKQQFHKLNYKGIFNRKGNRIPEGLAVFFNNTRYKRVESKHIVLRDELERRRNLSHLWDVIKANEDIKQLFLQQSTSLQVTVLFDKFSNRVLIIANTHLYYRSEADPIRLIQIYIATTYLQGIKQRYLNDNNNVSVIFCGDFNSNPEKSLLDYMINGYINPKHEDRQKISKKGKLQIDHKFMFGSACGTPKYTNYTPTFKECLDYIFIEINKLSVQRVIHNEDLDKYVGLPNQVYPSDHVALVVDLKFK